MIKNFAHFFYHEDTKARRITKNASKKTFVYLRVLAASWYSIDSILLI